MKKKTFYQTNILWQLFCFMFLAVFITCFIVGVQLIVGIINNGLGESVTDIVLSIILLILYFFSNKQMLTRKKANYMAFFQKIVYKILFRIFKN